MFEEHTEYLTIGNFSVRIIRVTNTDQLYEQLVAKGESHEDVADERIPYWADLWPSALGLSEHLLKERRITAGTSVHEIGCGLGLPGIVAGMMGAKVILSDYNSDAIRFAEKNWNLNCKSEAFFKVMDWRKPDESLAADILLGADLVYERRTFEILPATFSKLIKPGGKIILGEPNRLYAKDFFQSLSLHGFTSGVFEYPVSYRGLSSRISVYELTRD